MRPAMWASAAIAAASVTMSAAIEHTGFARCALQVLSSDTPRFLFSKRPIDEQRCLVKRLPRAVRARVAFRSDIDERVVDAILGAGDAVPLEQSDLSLGQVYESAAVVDMCLPEACTLEDVPFALYLISALRSPGSVAEAMILLRLSQSVMMIKGTDLDLDDHVDAPGPDASERTKHDPVDMHWATLQLERAANILLARVRELEFQAGRFQALQLQAQWPALTHGAEAALVDDGISPASFGRHLINAHLWAAHRSNSAMEFTFGVSDPRAAFHTMGEVCDERARLYIVAAAELGVEEMKMAATRDAFSMGWPIRGPSAAEPAFPGQALPAHYLRNVCVRDRATDTEYLDAGGSISTGRRLELLTVGLDRAAADRLDELPLTSRFVVTHLASTGELAERVERRSVRALGGTTVFIYDGHRPSCRCPDCANIEHALADDLLAELAAWHRDGGAADQVVLNSRGSVGFRGPKAWFEQLVRHIAGDTPVMEMPMDGVFCFDRVILTFQTSAYNFQGHHWSDDGLGMRSVLEWARGRVLSSVGVPARVAGEVLMYARQDESGSKARRWLEYEAVAQAVDARVIDFRSMSFEEEVRTMHGASVFATVTGAHHAAILFMPPGSAWVELHCPEISAAYADHLGFTHLAAALGVRFESVEGMGCPPHPRGALYGDGSRMWLETAAHPLAVLAALLPELELVVSARQACLFVAQSGDVRDSSVLERQADLLAALERCSAWSDDCNGVRSAGEGWELLRRRGGDWARHACADSVDGRLAIRDRTALAEHSSHDVDLRAPPGVVPRIQQLHMRVGA